MAIRLETSFPQRGMQQTTQTIWRMYVSKAVSAENAFASVANGVHRCRQLFSLGEPDRDLTSHRRLKMPKIETQPEQAYVGKRVIMPMSDFETKVPALTGAISEWLDQNGIRPTGKPFLRYHVIDMPDRMDVEVAIPVNCAPRADTGIDHGALPAGRYAKLTFTGIRNGIPANKSLIDWIADQGEKMVVYKSKNGDAFESRYETMLTDAKVEPDQDKWETEIAIKVCY